MSGGHFDYDQYRIRTIHETIESEILRMGKPRPNGEVWSREDVNYPIYDEEVLKILKDAVKYLKIAEVYAQRVDWFLSGDDGEESLIDRLKSDLSKLEIDDHISHL